MACINITLAVLFLYILAFSANNVSAQAVGNLFGIGRCSGDESCGFLGFGSVMSQTDEAGECEQSCKLFPFLNGNSDCGGCGADVGGQNTPTAPTPTGVSTPSPASTTSASFGSGPGNCVADVWEESLRLTRLVNEYRDRQGKAMLPVSISLIATAQAHVENYEEGGPFGILEDTCNGHSWHPLTGTNNCCYTKDHANKECMWAKPRETTAAWNCGQFNTDGFEISTQASVDNAVEEWARSSEHLNVMISNVVWEPYTKSIGCAAGSTWSHCWFSALSEDPNNALQ